MCSFRPKGILVAHGNLKFAVVRYSDETVKPVEPFETHNHRSKKNDVILIKNFAQENEYCEINSLNNIPDDRKPTKTKQSGQTLTNLTVGNSRVNNSMILNYSYHMMLILRVSDWIPAKLYATNSINRRLSYVPVKDASNNNIDVPPFRANIGAFLSSSRPNHWSMKRSFYVVPLLKSSIWSSSFGPTIRSNDQVIPKEPSQFIFPSSICFCTVEDLQLAEVSY